MTFAFARRAGVCIVTTAMIFAAMPASAAVTLRITGTNDAAFENQGGSLQAYYNLANPSVPGGTVLPPLERAVGQIRMGNDRRALYLPTAATGTPSADGGAGVSLALTNASPYAKAETDFSSGVPVTFSMARVGNVVTYTLGSNVLSGNARTSMGDINAFEFRIRSNAPPNANPTWTNSILISDLVYSDDITTNQTLADLSAANGAVNIGLWDGVVGDFTLTGKYTVSWTGTRPGGSALASQLKMLSVPLQPVGPIPEPASWILLIGGFGLTGAAMRRRGSVATLSS